MTTATSATDERASERQEAAETGDGFTTEPIFPALQPGRQWLAAQDAGLTTWDVFDTRIDSDNVVQMTVAGIFYDEDFALKFANGRPVCRDQYLTGTWVH